MLNRILAIVGWFGTALVMAAVAVRFLRPQWAEYATWGAWAGLACVLLYTLGQWREIVALFRHRQARLGSVAVASVLVVLGILVAVNYLGSRHNTRWDLTASGQFSLSDQTRKVVAGLDAPLRLLVFARELEFPRFRDRLDGYQYLSKQVAAEYIDPDKKPGLARQYQVQAYNTIVVEYKDRSERVASDAEQDLTNAIIKVVSGKERKVYFLQGHGERDTGSSERSGYSAIATALGRDNYKMDKVVLAQQADVPADADVLVVAGPRNDLLPSELDAIRRYLAKGGKLLVMLDPPEKAAAADPAGLTGLLKEWGFEVGHNIVVDASGVGQLLGTGPESPVVATYPSHPITERFNVLTAFPLARAVSAATGGGSGKVAQSFLETSGRSWSETDIDQLMKTGEVNFDEGKGDKRGPVSIGAAVSAPATAAPEGAEGRKPESRMVVVGDSDFAANYAIGIQGNKDLFLNTVNWLSQQENLIAIRPREPDDRRITITADQQRIVFWLALVILPGLIVGTGVYTWWRRR